MLIFIIIISNLFKTQALLEENMFNKDNWVEMTRGANKLFTESKYIESLDLYEDILSMFEEHEEDLYLFQNEDQIQLLDMYIISCHNICDCMDRIDLSANLIKYAYRPIALIQRLYNGIEILDSTELQSRLDHCISYYAGIQSRSNPKFIKSRLSALVRDIQLTT